MLSPAALALERQLRAAAHEPPLDRELDRDPLAALRDAGLAIRLGSTMHVHPDALPAVERRLRAVIGAEGQITLARLRDELGTSRKFAKALLDHFDRARVTIRCADDARTLRERGAP